MRLLTSSGVTPSALDRLSITPAVFSVRVRPGWMHTAVMPEGPSSRDVFCESCDADVSDGADDGAGRPGRKAADVDDAAASLSLHMGRCLAGGPKVPHDFDVHVRPQGFGRHLGEAGGLRLAAGLGGTIHENINPADRRSSPDGSFRLADIVASLVVGLLRDGESWPRPHLRL